MLLHKILEEIGDTPGRRPDDAFEAAETSGDPAAADITSVAYDSRRVSPGAIFCCVAGASADGHDHAPAAVAAGAGALLVERFLPLAVPQVKVASVRRAMAPLSAVISGQPSRRMKVLGVTGTNGKTTTTYLLEAVARAAGLRTGVVGTVETRIGGEVLPSLHTTPEAPDLQALFARMVAAGVGVAAVEVSSHALALHRADATWFTAACFTNLSHDHLDFHGSVDEYFEAKARLFDPARCGGAALNVDDPAGAELARRSLAAGLVTLTFGIAERSAAVRAESVEVSAGGNRFRLVTPAGAVNIHSPLVGRFNVANALGAAATALLAGLPLPAVAAGLAAPLVVPGRMERVDAGQPFAVVVDYAHTPDGLEQVLRAGRGLVSGGRLRVVFGCGGDRDRAKRPVMGEIAARLADDLVVTSDNPRSEEPGAITAEVEAGIPAGTRCVTELDRRAAIARALAAAGPGDVVVIAGKGHEPGQTARGVTVPFDDREVAREELAALGHRRASSGRVPCG